MTFSLYAGVIASVLVDFSSRAVQLLYNAPATSARLQQCKLSNGKVQFDAHILCGSMFIAIFPLEFVTVTNATLTERRWEHWNKRDTNNPKASTSKKNEYIPACNGKIETCRVFGNPKCFPFHYDKMRDNEANGKKRVFFFLFQTLIHVMNGKRQKKMRLHSMHGLLKQKFIRFMHSCGQCYIISTFDLRLFFRSYSDFVSARFEEKSRFFFVIRRCFKLKDTVVIHAFQHSTCCCKQASSTNPQMQRGKSVRLYEY